MKISAVEKYGLRCLLVLARAGVGNQLSISEIADKEGLSVPYVSKLLSILRKSELVTAERGRRGGFSIAKDPADINLYDVITALDGPLISSDHCTNVVGSKDECIHMDNCSVHDVLGGLAGYVRIFLSQVTLETLISEKQLSDAKLVRSRVITPEGLLSGLPESKTKS